MDWREKLRSIRPVATAVPSRWTLLRQAAAEGGVTVCTPDPSPRRAAEAEGFRGYLTTVTLLGDVTTYRSPGAPVDLLGQHEAKIRTALDRLFKAADLAAGGGRRVFWGLRLGAGAVAVEELTLGSLIQAAPQAIIAAAALYLLAEGVRLGLIGYLRFQLRKMTV